MIHLMIHLMIWIATESLQPSYRDFCLDAHPSSHRHFVNFVRVMWLLCL